MATCEPSETSKAKKQEDELVQGKKNI